MDIKIILFAAAALLILTLLFLVATILNLIYYRITGGMWEDGYQEIEHETDQSINERTADQENKAIR